MAEVDIIDLWNKGKGPAPAEQEFNLDELVSKKSKTPLYWIKTILWIEFWLNLLSFPLMFILFKDDEPVLYGIIMPVIILIYLVYYQFLIRQIKAYDFSVDVKTGLKKLYDHLNFFFLHYKVLVWFFIPLSFVYGVYVSLQEKATEEFGSKEWLIIIVTGVVACGILSLVFNFLLNLIYGRKIRRLKGIVQELDTEDET